MSAAIVRYRTIALALGIMGCGTVGSTDGLTPERPANRTGPFREVTGNEMGMRSCAVVDFQGLVDEPSATRADDGRTVLYLTREHGEVRSIARVALRAPAQQADDPADVLVPALDWEGTAVRSPHVVRDGAAWVMVYGTATGALGLARSTDGLAWTRHPTPLLTADPAQGEDTPLRAPSIARTPDGAWMLAYASAGAIWFARASRAEGPFTRVDGDPSTPRRDAVLGATGPTMSPDGGAPGFESGALDDPDLFIESTAIGRAIWRVYYTARSAPVAMDGGVAPEVTVGMAASFDGRTFTRFGVPVFRSRTDPTYAAPSVLAVDERRTLLYVGARCAVSRGRRGVRVGIAPGTDTVTPAP